MTRRYGKLGMSLAMAAGAAALVAACGSDAKSTGSSTAATSTTSAAATQPLSTTSVAVVTTGGATTEVATTAAPTTQVATTVAGLGANTLTVTGSVSSTLHESENSASSCQVGASGAVNGRLAFDSDDNEYVLQFALPVGSTTFPDPSGTSSVALYATTDSSTEWTAGTKASAAAAGTVTFDGEHGTIDLDMLPDAPKPNPALGPIHVTGTFDCPS